MDWKAVDPTESTSEKSASARGRADESESLSSGYGSATALQNPRPLEVRESQTEGNDLRVSDSLANPDFSAEVNEVIELLDVSFPVGRDYIERAVAGILSDPGKEGQLYRLRSIDGDLIATVTYGQVYGDGWDGETFVRFFAVHPDHRRQGHAAWIIKKIMNDAQACGSRCVVLSSLQSDKIAAGIWERRGFTVYATQPCEEYPENGHHDCYVYWFSES